MDEEQRETVSPRAASDAFEHKRKSGLVNLTDAQKPASPGRTVHNKSRDGCVAPIV
jgi:hypothetical protein